MNQIKRLLFPVIILVLLSSCNNDSSNNGTSNSNGEIQNPTFKDSLQSYTLNPEESIQSGPGSCTPNPNSRNLSMTLKAQEENFWCWAASGEMVMEKLGATITQCDEANKRLGRADCCNSPTPNDCDKGGWPEFEKYGFTADHTTNAALSWTNVKKQIDCQETPFCATWKYTNGNGGHMVVISGYKILNGVKQVRMRDPLPVNRGSSRWITYTYYVSHPGYKHWNDYYNIEKR